MLWNREDKLNAITYSLSADISAVLETDNVPLGAYMYK